MNDHLACEQSPNCMSTVTTQHVNCGAPSISTVRPPSISTVSWQHVNSEPTVDMQLKQGFLAEIHQRGSKPFSFDVAACISARWATSCAATRRGLVFGRVAYVKDKNKTSRSARP